MKKRNLMVAAAVLAAWVVCTQSAMAQSNVKVYGRLNVDMERITFDKPSGTGSGDVTRLSSNSSRLGFRGTEELGGGLRVIYQIEASVDVDAGSGTLAGRDTYVGLAGSWGTFRAGRFDDVMKGMGGYTDRFRGSGIANDGTVAAMGGGGGGFTRTQANSVLYDSPSLNGFSGKVQYALEDEKTHGKTALTAAGAYASGALRLGAGVGLHKNFVPNHTDTVYRIGAKYDFGQFDLAGGATRLIYRQDSGDIERDYWTVSVGYKLGSGEFSVKYGSAGDAGGSAPDGSLSQAGSDGARLYQGADSGAKVYVIGYEHNLSKRTQLYAYGTRIANEANANYRFGTNGLNSPAAGPGASPTGWALGIVHDF